MMSDKQQKLNEKQASPSSKESSRKKGKTKESLSDEKALTGETKDTKKVTASTTSKKTAAAADHKDEATTSSSCESSVYNSDLDKELSDHDQKRKRKEGSKPNKGSLKEPPSASAGAASKKKAPPTKPAVGMGPGGTTRKRAEDILLEENGPFLDDVDSKRARLAAASETAATDDTAAWSEDLHRAFVEAVYDMGLKNASPSVILEHMTQLHDALTSERVKSHLQKYRNRKDKSKAEFLLEYDSWLQKALTMGAAGAGRMTAPRAICEMMGQTPNNNIVGGDLAAYLTYSILSQDEPPRDAAAGAAGTAVMSPDILRSGSQEYARHFTGARIPFPSLTEEERRSPLGVSISHVMGLFYSMTQYLMKERQEREQKEAAAAATANLKQEASEPPRDMQQGETATHPLSYPPRTEYAAAGGAYNMSGPPLDSTYQGVAGIDYRQSAAARDPTTEEDQIESQDRAEV